ncbi:hypothetical protein [Terrisporobacter hibernicus]|nr:hypothetical protein [Terrisporobacter hibernicus]
MLKYGAMAVSTTKKELW